MPPPAIALTAVPGGVAATAGAGSGDAVQVATRFLPADLRDGLAGTAALLVWLLVTAVALVSGVGVLADLLDLGPDVGHETRELARFVRDALQELVGLVFVVLLAHCGYRWARGVTSIEVGRAGVRLNRRFGRASELEWRDIGEIRQPGWLTQWFAASWPAFPSRYASPALGALRHYRLVARGRPVYLSLESPLVFELALARWRPAAPPHAPASRWRQAGRIFARALSPVLLALCFAPAFVLVAAPIKYMAEWAVTGSNYQASLLLRAFLLKPSAAMPAARQPMLVAAVRIADPFVVRRVLEPMGSLRELELDPPIVELAARGAGVITRDPSGVLRASGPGPDAAYAREAERIEIVRMLIAHRARIEQGALLAAALRGHARLFDALVSLGAPVDDVDDRGIPDVATVAGAPGNGLLLYLQAKADLQRTDEQGNTPLAYAALGGREGNIDLLLKHGASVEAANHAGETPLLFVLRAARTAQAQAGARLLIARRANPAARAADGSTAAHFAARGGPAELLEQVVAASGGYQVTNHGGTTLLHAAAEHGAAPEMIRHLMARGVSVHATDRAGATPLHVARNAAVAGALLAGGAEPGARDAAGRSPLHAAARRMDVELAKLLIARGARKDAPDRDGRIPLDDVPRTGAKVRQLADLLKP